MSLLFVDPTTIAELNERSSDRAAPPTCSRSRSTTSCRPRVANPTRVAAGPGTPSDPSDPPTLLGDVVVCPAVATRQAAERGVTAEDELALLVVHGVLHLLDYDHAEPSEAS